MFLLAGAGVLLALVLGIALRLDDPLSTSVLAAEDPFTHMALVREHLRDGNLDALNEGGGLYPPGLHAYLASVWSYTGTDLSELFRIGPVILGAIGILGVALLLGRLEGAVAAVVGAMAYAVAPEFIFRTTMMSPTALDLALLPFLLFALIEVVRGDLRWALPAGLMMLLVVFAHPWLTAILALAGVVFLLLCLAVPWARRENGAPTWRGLGTAGAIVAGGAALAIPITAVGGNALVGDLVVELPTSLVVAIALAGLAVVAVAAALASRRSLRDRVLNPAGPRPFGLVARFATTGLIVALLLVVTLPALQRGMAEFVDLPRSFGWPLLVLAAAALVGLAFVSGPAGHMGAALVAATLPFVLYNPFGSPYWPHRTAVFLGVGLALLAGVAGAAVPRVLSRAQAAWRRKRTSSTSPRARAGRFSVLAGLVAIVFLSSAIYAATPVPYPGGWYRLYQECEYDAFQKIAVRADGDPDAFVVTGDWQAKLVLGALTANASRVWLKPEFFTDEEDRNDLVAIERTNGRSVYVVVDDYLRLENPGASTDFLADEGWREVGSWCAGMGLDGARVSLHASRGGSS